MEDTNLSKMLLAGDIGATKTTLAVYSPETGPHEPLLEKTFDSSRYENLEIIIHEFLTGVEMPVKRACFGVAGPVIAGRVRITNLTWLVDEVSLKSEFDLTGVKLLNDMESIAHAIPILKSEDIQTLNAGKPVSDGNIAILAPGTGLGEGFLTYANGRYHPHGCEGSHASFAPVGQLQIGLLEYLNQKGYDHVSFERVCSGGFGIPILYNYLRDIGHAPEPAWLAEQLSGSDDPTPIIVDAAQDQTQSCELCVATLNLFVTILGAEAGNLALKILSTGGIYLGGGIPPRILEYLHKPVFLESLCAKGRFREILGNMPVNVITNSKVGLMGAAACGLS